MEKKKAPHTSWEESGDWYDKIVGEKGHYYHEHVIFPRLLKLINLSPSSSLLDLACGQGVLGRQLPPSVKYVGIDASPRLIQAAQKYRKKNVLFYVGDVSETLSLEVDSFTHGTLILAAQNIEQIKRVFQNFQKHLKPGGQLIIVLNHPCFRIPRQSGWIVDPIKKLQSRRIDRYMSPLKIPISTHPGQKERSVQTWSYHIPLSHYCQLLKETGFYIESLEEWCSDKMSTGKTAVMENRARKEFPLFLALSAIKY